MSANPAVKPVKTSMVERTLLLGAILISPFQNTVLGDSALSFLGYSPSWFFVIALSPFALMQMRPYWAVHWPKIILWLILFTLVSAYYLGYFNYEFRGRNLILKTAINFVIVAPFVLLGLVYRTDLRGLRLPVVLAFIVCAAGMVLADILKMSIFQEGGSLTSYPNAQMRPRGFSMESSTFSSSVIALAFCAMSLWRSTWARALIALTAILCVFESGSKGGAAIIVLAGAAVFVVNTRRWWLTLLALPVALPLILLATSDVQNQLAQDRHDYTSVATRSFLAFSAMEYGARHPMGTGLGTLAPSIIEAMESNLAFYSSTVGRGLNYAEVMTFLKGSTDEAVTTKAAIGDLLLMIGWIALPVLIWMFNPLPAMRRGEFIISTGQLTMFFMLCSYISIFGCTHIVIWAVIARSMVANHEQKAMAAKSAARSIPVRAQAY